MHRRSVERACARPRTLLSDESESTMAIERGLDQSPHLAREDLKAQPSGAQIGERLVIAMRKSKRREDSPRGLRRLRGKRPRNEGYRVRRVGNVVGLEPCASRTRCVPAGKCGRDVAAGALRAVQCGARNTRAGILRSVGTTAVGAAERAGERRESPSEEGGPDSQHCNPTTHYESRPCSGELRPAPRL